MLLWSGFFSFTVQTNLFFAVLKGDAYCRSARISQNRIKVE